MKYIKRYDIDGLEQDVEVDTETPFEACGCPDWVIMNLERIEASNIALIGVYDLVDGVIGDYDHLPDYVRENMRWIEEHRDDENDQF